MPKKKYLLSVVDFVPEGYFSLTEIFETRCLNVSEERAKELRNGSFLAVKEYCQEAEISDLPAFWNENSDLMTSDMNWFLRNPKIEPVAHLIEMFERIERSTHTKGFLTKVSFGIKEEYLKEYLESKGKIIPKKEKRGRPKTDSAVRYNFAKFVIGEPGEKHSIVKVRRNPTYLKFKEWCRINKTTVNNGALMALQCLLDSFPCGGLSDEKETDKIDPGSNPKSEPGKLSKACLTLDLSVKDTAKTIVKNYNADPKNCNKEKLSLSKYTTYALNKYNQEMPLRYSDPDLYNYIQEEKKQDKIRKAKLQSSIENQF